MVYPGTFMLMLLKWEGPTLLFWGEKSAAEFLVVQHAVQLHPHLLATRILNKISKMLPRSRMIDIMPCKSLFFSIASISYS